MFHDAGVESEIDFSSPQFSVLAVLMLAAKKPGRGRNRGYLTASEIRAHIEFNTRIRPTHRDINQQISRVRKGFASSYPDGEYGIARSHQILRFHKRLGYKLLIPEQYMEIEFLDSEPTEQDSRSVGLQRESAAR